METSLPRSSCVTLSWICLAVAKTSLKSVRSDSDISAAQPTALSTSPYPYLQFLQNNVAKSFGIIFLKEPPGYQKVDNYLPVWSQLHTRDSRDSSETDLRQKVSLTSSVCL